MLKEFWGKQPKVNANVVLKFQQIVQLMLQKLENGLFSAFSQSLLYPYFMGVSEI